MFEEPYLGILSDTSLCPDLGQENSCFDDILKKIINYPPTLPTTTTKKNNPN